MIFRRSVQRHSVGDGEYLLEVNSMLTRAVNSMGQEPGIHRQELSMLGARDGLILVLHVSIQHTILGITASRRCFLFVITR